ncbi:histidine kinase-, DNA gyrase B-, and HSP90-like ATPase family protein [Mycobacterium kansasii]|uniref:histidine kinase n=1 Tax=Mycobacterium kansasii TaxID=1768 RepID=A0A1V3XI00_MYCKA|nr:histidine kinase-, DNA gyrase B-, and HSP90-like ATPase family protein [Mycobacterium kansasii]
MGVTLRQLDPSHAELVVSDRGPGIPPQERRLVFERFYRSASARAMPGSGLGLAIVKQVVLNHGGSLRVEDTVPGGQPREHRFPCCCRPPDAGCDLPGDPGRYRRQGRGRPF